MWRVSLLNEFIGSLALTSPGSIRPPLSTISHCSLAPESVVKMSLCFTLRALFTGGFRGDGRGGASAAWELRYTGGAGAPADFFAVCLVLGLVLVSVTI